MAIDDVIACHFVDPDFQVEIFSEKEEVAKIGERADGGGGGIGVQGNFMQSLSAVCFFINFFGGK